MAKQTTFQSDWLNDSQFQWLGRVPTDNKSARCNICQKTFNLSNMGRRAVISHMNGGKHKKNISAFNSSASLRCFLKADKPPSCDIGLSLTSDKNCSGRPNLPLAQINSDEGHDAVSQLESESQISKTFTAPRGMQYFIANDNVTKAEILWAIESVMTHTSMRAAGRHVSLFTTMFPDSEIAKKMQLQRDKVSYLITHGLSPFFQNELVKKINQCDFFVVGFDESLNKVAQKQQMDLNVRFWDPEDNEVKTRYLTSVFLERSTATDLLQAFRAGLQNLDCRKILQVSMDGPNVNHKFLKDLKAELKTEPNDKSILDMGSCGLHTLHCAFKSAMLITGWDIVPFLRALYNLFKDSPARRAIFTNITGSSLFPKKFCAVRWIENVSVVQRAIEILPDIKTFIGEMSKTNQISTHSFDVVASHIKDDLLGAKLEFFKGLASDIEPFLRQYQSDIPLAPFLFGDLSHQIKTQMEQIVVPDVLEGSSSITKIDLSEKNLLPAKTVKLGIATKSAIRKANDKKRVEDKKVLIFRDDVRRALLKFVKNLLEKSPLHYKLTRAVSCFDPKVAQCEKMSKVRMESLLTILLDNNWATSVNVDVVLREYISLCSSPQVVEGVRCYSRETRLYHFWMAHMTGNEYENLRKVWKLVSTLSHGNANVERGFSINSECVVENMREELLVARRCVYDSITCIGGIKNLDISKPLIHSARNSYSKYKEYMATKGKKNESESAKKRKASQQLKELEEKKAKLLQDAQREADLLSQEIKKLQKM